MRNGTGSMCRGCQEREGGKIKMGGGREVKIGKDSGKGERL